MYAGLAWALAVFLIVGSKRGGIPTKGYMVASGVAFAAWAADGAGNFLGLWESGGAVRFGAGGLAGVFLAPYLAALFWGVLEGGERRPIAGVSSAVWMFAAVAAGAALNAGAWGGLLAAESYAAAAGVVLVLAVAHTAVLVLILGRGRLFAAVAAAPFTAGGQLAALAVLRNLIGI